MVANEPIFPQVMHPLAPFERMPLDIARIIFELVQQDYAEQVDPFVLLVISKTVGDIALAIPSLWRRVVWSAKWSSSPAGHQVLAMVRAYSEASGHSLQFIDLREAGQLSQGAAARLCSLAHLSRTTLTDVHVNVVWQTPNEPDSQEETSIASMPPRHEADLQAREKHSTHTVADDPDSLYTRTVESDTPDSGIEEGLQRMVAHFTESGREGRKPQVVELHVCLTPTMPVQSTPSYGPSRLDREGKIALHAVCARRGLFYNTRALDTTFLTPLTSNVHRLRLKDEAKLDALPILTNTAPTLNELEWQPHNLFEWGSSPLELPRLRLLKILVPLDRMLDIFHNPRCIPMSLPSCEVLTIPPVLAGSLRAPVCKDLTILLRLTTNEDLIEFLKKSGSGLEVLTLNFDRVLLRPGAADSAMQSATTLLLNTEVHFEQLKELRLTTSHPEDRTSFLEGIAKDRTDWTLQVWTRALRLDPALLLFIKCRCSSNQPSKVPLERLRIEGFFMEEQVYVYLRELCRESDIALSLIPDPSASGWFEA